METKIKALWKAIADQNEETMRSYFHEDAMIRWHATNECFDLNEYIRANCEYPGNWNGAVERIEIHGDTSITVARVWMQDNHLSFHVVAFYRWINGQIIEADEYWGDDGEAPQWRTDMHIGRKIHSDK